MGSIILQATGFLLIISVAYLLKQGGLFKQSDGHLLSKVIVNLTLPAAIILGFNGVEVNSIFFYLILIGFLTNVVLVFFGGFIWKKKDPIQQGFMMFGISGYNIGNFTLPFVQGFFSAAVPFLCMFDMGNALMLSGGSTILVEKMTGKSESKFSALQSLKRLFSSPPFTVYILMFFLAIFHITIPKTVLSYVHLFASGNAFLSMFMIGLYLEISIQKTDLKLVSKVLVTRYLLATVVACFFYFVLPFPLFIRKVLVLLAFAPIGSLSTISSIAFGCKASVAGFISSASIILSLIIMTGILIVLL
ncbi:MULTISPECIES: AEC family transporter [Carnobacterium]|uniref:AEC family transporter n=1 Tax=Carnobacterium TaxID=2747 RepID=UPI001072C070|nr:MULTISPECIES: AEC family transporter [Carnobacterium]MDT1939904.1 hypothetical protein [Carnobacterium divergens]MDT1942342.1 hypothetical protein [Carnobacterium divergens]MDT1948148.1 hypothetical protein [Carnobacterium divergens]MDT1950628.1 hypothetical protein [Carnobacterium divergens]MDT1955908.1 hypothetical protein [Carnobacterium divergens]